MREIILSLFTGKLAEKRKSKMKYQKSKLHTKI